MMQKEWTERFGVSLVQHRWVYLVVVLLLSALSLINIAQRLKQGIPVDFTPQAIVYDEGPELRRLKEIEVTFGREDNDLLFMLNGQGLSAIEGRDYLEATHTLLSESDQTISVDSLVNAQILINDGLMPELVPLWSNPETAMALASQDKALAGRLISKDGLTTVIRARLDPNLEKVAELGPVVQHLKNEVQQLALPEDVALHITGVPFVRQEVVSMMMSDNYFFAPLLSVIFLLVITLIFRRPLVAMAPMVGVLTAVLWALGLLFAMGVTFNILSVLIPILGLIIGVADGIHLVSRYQEALSARPEAKEWAMGQTLRHMTKACFLTTFTTAAGFFSLLSADTSVIRDFGLHCSVAVMVAYVAVIIVTPLYLAFLPVHRAYSIKLQSSKNVFDSLHEWVSKHTNWAIISVMFLTLISGYMALSVKANSRLLEMYQPEHETHQAIRLAESELAGVVPIFIHFEAKTGDMMTPERLQMMADVESALQAQDIIIQTVSLSGVVSGIHEGFTGDFTIPSSTEAIQQELLAVQTSAELPLSSIKNLDGSKARILATALDAGGREYLKMKREIENQIDQIVETDDVLVELTGDGIMASAGIDKLIDDLLSSLGWVIGVISLTMLLLLRSVSLMFISVVPNLIPLIFSLATLHLMGVDLQTSNIVSFSVSIGLAVDDTIHFMVRYSQEIDEGTPHEQAVRKSFRSAGKAIVLTSILLIAGFGALATSELTTTHHFGVLSCVTLLGAVLADLVLLPALLNLRHRVKGLRILS